MPLCCGFTPFMKLSLAKCVFFMFHVAGKTLLFKRKQKTFSLILLTMKGNVSIVKKKEQVFTETECHNRRNFLKRKHVHCVLCGGDTFEVTQEIWDKCYAHLNS